MFKGRVLFFRWVLSVRKKPGFSMDGVKTTDSFN